MRISQLNTEQLIEQCVHQNQEAQLEIYNRYYKAMYNAALRVVKNTAEAEDIMQEAFLKAFTKLEMLNDYEMFGAWLKRIVINLSIGTLKKENRREKVAMDKVGFLVSENETTENERESLQANEVVGKLQELKDSYRIVLSLNFIEGYDYEEIGEIMELTQGNVRTLISRAKDSLRKKLQVV